MNAPVDFIITWVDGNDEKWLEEKKKHMPQKDIEGAKDNRFRDFGLLRYMFRAFEEFTPWVNKIYFITWGHIPKWLNTEHPKLKIVRHEDYIPKEYLPTFSSRPIELNFHRIEGLSERFVYFNDDTFPIRPLEESAFFDGDLPRDIFIQSMVRPVSGELLMSNTQKNNLEITKRYFTKKEFLKKHLFKYLCPKYGKYFVRNLAFLAVPELTGFRSLHSAASYLKSTFETVWANEGDILDRTARCKFRDGSNINQYIFAQYQIMSGKFSPINPARRKYFVVGENREKYEKVILKQRADIICLNDVKGIDFEKERRHLEGCFESMLPNKSAFEVD